MNMMNYKKKGKKKKKEKNSSMVFNGYDLNILFCNRILDIALFFLSFFFNF